MSVASNFFCLGENKPQKRKGRRKKLRETEFDTTLEDGFTNLNFDKFSP